jgi:hypothetical protein
MQQLVCAPSRLMSQQSMPNEERECELYGQNHRLMLNSTILSNPFQCSRRRAGTLTLESEISENNNKNNTDNNNNNNNNNDNNNNNNNDNNNNNNSVTALL